jgi:ribosomal protein L12E/L44/L45/RPP1/RPP2
VGASSVTNWLFERRQRDAAVGAESAGIRTSTGEKTLEERAMPLVMPVYSPELTRSSAASAGGAAAPAAAGTAEPSAWHGNEMGAAKMSDNYSFLTDAFTLEKGGSMSRIVRNFEQLGGATAAAAAAAAATPRTKKEEELLRNFEAFSRSRDADIPGQTKRI